MALAYAGNVTKKDIADKLGVKKAYFTHMTHDVLHKNLEKELPPNMYPAYDGLSIEV